MADQMFMLRPDDLSPTSPQAPSETTGATETFQSLLGEELLSFMTPHGLPPADPGMHWVLPRDPHWMAQSSFAWRRPATLPLVGQGEYYESYAEVVDRYSDDHVDFADADLSDCNLSGEDLPGIDLARANLRNVDLSDANLQNANLSGADLTNADLSRADLTDANLTGAWIGGAAIQSTEGLTRDQLASCAGMDILKTDLFGYLDHMPHEVEGLLATLRAGRIDGSTYDGNCACLAGTCERFALARIGRSQEELELAREFAERLRDASSPREAWFYQIRRGDTPESSAIAELTEEWLEEYLAALPSRYIQVPVLPTSAV